MNKTIEFQDAARQNLLRGAEILARAVSTTLGPKGYNVLIEDPKNFYRVLHDGVSVANAISSDDPQINAGITLLREASRKQVDEVGDGTTVVTILALEILREAYKVASSGVNMMTLRRDLEMGAEVISQAIKEAAVPVETDDQLVQVATISAEDPELGKLVGELIAKVGPDGVVTVEESRSSDTVVEHQEGMQFDRGFVSSYFINDPVKMASTLEHAHLFLSDSPLTSFGAMIPILQKYAESKMGSTVVFIAPEISGDFLASMIKTKLDGGMQVNCVTAPYFESKQVDFLQDIAVLTGGKVFSERAGMRLDEIGLEVFGEARRVTSTKDATLIVGGKGDTDDILARVDSLRAQLSEEETDSFEGEKLKERIAKLGNGVAVIRVGGTTESEMKERKERVLDAVSATRAAQEEGIVPGGEVAYFKGLEALMKARISDHARTILGKAVRAPFNKLMENGGYEPGGMFERFMSVQKENWGFNVMTGELVDLYKAEIIDPAKVPSRAIVNAVSVAILIMSIDALSVIEPEKKN